LPLSDRNCVKKFFRSCVVIVLTGVASTRVGSAVKVGVIVGVIVSVGVMAGVMVNVGNIVRSGMALGKPTVWGIDEQPPINSSDINPEILCARIFFLMKTALFTFSFCQIRNTVLCIVRASFNIR